jgi:adenylylsulfate kinase-like enzyme
MPVIWITGLPGAGKSSTAAAVVERLRRDGDACVQLDGDQLRLALAPLAGGYDIDSRRRLAHAYGALAALLDAQGLTVVVATVSLFHEIHAANRARFAEYLEVLLVCDEAMRARRRSQEGPQVGIDIAAELPVAPDLALRSDALPPAAIARAILTQWRDRHGR